MVEIKITESEQNQRLDKFLLKYLNKANKSFVYKMLRKKNIKLNEKKAEGSEMLQLNDTVKLFLSDETIESFREVKEVKKSTKTIQVIYEDENILVVNKPQGVLIHPDSSDKIDTMIDRVLSHLVENGSFDPKDSLGFTPAICNRLDLNTSGVIIVGKNLQSVQRLNYLFKNKMIDKNYKCIVVGRVEKGGTILGKHFKNAKTNEVKILSHKVKNDELKDVETRYEVLEKSEKYTLLKVKLITGKSHQIRASLMNINHPIVGDRKYGDETINMIYRRKYAINNQLLHAESLEIFDEDGPLSYLNNKEFVATLPRNFEKVYNDIFR